MLIGSVLVFLSPLAMFAATVWNWRSPLLLIPMGVGWLVGPLLLYIAIRRMTKTGRSSMLLVAALLSALGLALWIFAIYFALHYVRRGFTA
jgi:hypothetical protein